MAVVTVSGAKRDLSDLLNRVAYGRERIIVESRGKPKVTVWAIGRRNDEEVYKLLKRRLG